MPVVILYGIGSPILIDYEESLHRVGTTIAAGVRNHEGQSHLPDGVAMVRPDQLDAALRSIPFLVPLFTPAHRVIAANEALALGLRPREPLIDPTSIVPRRVQFGQGSYVNAGCCLGSGSRFGAFAIVNRGVTIGHDAAFGAFVSVGPGAVVAGNVTIGDQTMLGTGCTILPGITIGDDAVVGAGAVVTRDVPSGCVVAGNPAKILRKNER